MSVTKRVGLDYCEEVVSEESGSKIEPVVKLLREFSDDDRQKIFSNFCRGCTRYMSRDERCYCMNDE